jgi:hypothetical protein
MKLAKFLLEARFELKGGSRKQGNRQAQQGFVLAEC